MPFEMLGAFVVGAVALRVHRAAAPRCSRRRCSDQAPRRGRRARGVLRSRHLEDAPAHRLARLRRALRGRVVLAARRRRRQEARSSSSAGRRARIDDGRRARDLDGFLKSLERHRPPALDKAMPRKAGDENELPDEPVMTLRLCIACDSTAARRRRCVRRPGGGQSYSGSRSSGGGGGLTRAAAVGRRRRRRALLPALPSRASVTRQVGVPLLIIVIIVFVAAHRAANANATQSRGWASQDYSSIAYSSRRRRARRGDARRPALARSISIRETDPDFSIVLFEDFLYTLYAEMKRARGQQGAMALGAYLSPGGAAGRRAAVAPSPSAASSSARCASSRIERDAAAVARDARFRGQPHRGRRRSASTSSIA